MKWSNLLFDTLSLRGWCYRTKTHHRGTPFACVASGCLLREASQDWATSYFAFLNHVRHACGKCFGADCDPDRLFFSFDEDEVSISYSQRFMGGPRRYSVTVCIWCIRKSTGRY